MKKKHRDPFITCPVCMPWPIAGYSVACLLVALIFWWTA